MFAGSGAGLAAGAVFTALLLGAGVSDLRTRRIPNVVVLVLLTTGIVYSTWRSPVTPGLVRGVEGMLVGFALWFPFYLLRLLGAGDVKLFAGAGAWLGPAGAVSAALVAALVGGVLALVVLAARGEVGKVLARLGIRLALLRGGSAPALAGGANDGLPYGVAMAVGAAVVAWFPHMGVL